MLSVVCLGATRANAQSARWSAELFAGSAFNVPTPLTIRQPNERELRFIARYATRPWSGSPYYAYRVGRWVAERAWEFELVHHKLYLTTRLSEVERFEISHGYNLLFVNRAGTFGRGVLRAGAGIVIAHPENTVRGRALDSKRGGLGGGYYAAGAVAQLAAERRWMITRRLFIATEAKITGAYARVPVADGRAIVPNLALHALAGVGYAR